MQTARQRVHEADASVSQRYRITVIEGFRYCFAMLAAVGCRIDVTLTRDSAHSPGCPDAERD